ALKRETFVRFLRELAKGSHVKHFWNKSSPVCPPSNRSRKPLRPLPAPLPQKHHEPTSAFRSLVWRKAASAWLPDMLAPFGQIQKSPSCASASASLRR